MFPRNSQVCNLEECIQLAPYALVALFQASLQLLVTTLQATPYISAKTLLAVAVYLSGLTVLDKRPTQANIANTIGKVSHDALNRIAKPIAINATLIANTIIYLTTGIPQLGYLILDDVVLPKPFSRYIAGAYMDYDPSQKRHIKCQRMVLLLWTNGWLCIPVAFAFWHQRDFVEKYRTKNQIARALVYWAVRHEIPFEYLTFDNWYASKQNLRLFARLEIVFVTRLRKNSWIEHQGCKQRVSQLRSHECHYYGDLQAYVRQFVVTYPRFGVGALALVKNDKHAEAGRTKYLFTNDLALTNRAFVQRYRSRWQVEVFFKTCKQSFGLAGCQAQMMPQVITHVRMVFMAYLLTQLLMEDNAMSIEHMQKNLRSLHWLALPNQQPILVTMRQDGTLIPTCLDQLVSPMRTWIPAMEDTQNLVITDFA